MNNFTVLWYMFLTFVMLGGCALCWNVTHTWKSSSSEPATLLHGRGIQDSAGIWHKRNEGRTYQLTPEEAQVVLCAIPSHETPTDTQTVLYIGRVTNKSPALPAPGIYLRLIARDGSWIIDPTPWAPLSPTVEEISCKYDAQGKLDDAVTASYTPWPMC